MHDGVSIHDDQSVREQQGSTFFLPTDVIKCPAF